MCLSGCCAEWGYFTEWYTTSIFKLAETETRVNPPNGLHMKSPDPTVHLTLNCHTLTRWFPTFRCTPNCHHDLLQTTSYAHVTKWINTHVAAELRLPAPPFIHKSKRPWPGGNRGKRKSLMLLMLKGCIPQFKKNLAGTHCKEKTSWRHTSAAAEFRGQSEPSQAHVLDDSTRVLSQALVVTFCQ